MLELARLVDDPQLADKLETNYGRMTKVLALTIPERETIIRALEDAPDGLGELRAVLLVSTSLEYATGSSGRLSDRVDRCLLPATMNSMRR